MIYDIDVYCYGCKSSSKGWRGKEADLLPSLISAGACPSCYRHDCLQSVDRNKEYYYDRPSLSIYHDSDNKDYVERYFYSLLKKLRTKKQLREKPFYRVVQDMNNDFISVQISCSDLQYTVQVKNLRTRIYRQSFPPSLNKAIVSALIASTDVLMKRNNRGR